MRLQGQVGGGAAADDGAEPGAVAAGHDDVGRFADQSHQIPGSPTVTTQTSSTACRQAGGTSPVSVSWARTG